MKNNGIAPIALNRFLSFVVLLFASSAFPAHVQAQTLFTEKLIGFSGLGTNNFSHISTLDGGSLLFGTSNTIFTQATMIKLDAAGNMMWQKSLDSVSMSAKNIVQSPVDSSYFFCGMTVDMINDEIYYSIVKIDKLGNIIFMRKLWMPPSYYIVNVGRSLARNDGSFYVTGTVHKPSVGSQWHLFGVDQNGNVTFSHCYGNGTSTTCIGLDTCSNGDALLLGYSTNPQNRPVALRATSAGNLVWVKAYTPSLPVVPYSITRTVDNGFCIVTGGGWGPNAYLSLLKIDEAGAVVWQQRYFDLTSGLYPEDIMQRPNGDLVICGDPFILKVDSAGTPLYARNFGAPGGGRWWKTVKALSDSVYTYSALVPPGSALFMTSDSSGVSCNGQATVVNTAAMTCTVNSFQGDYVLVMTNTPDIPLTTLVTVQFTDLCSILLSVPAEQKEGELIYPNPVNDELRIRFASGAENHTVVELFDARGRCVFTRGVAAGTVNETIDVASLAEGMYTCRISTGGSTTFIIAR